MVSSLQKSMSTVFERIPTEYRKNHAFIMHESFQPINTF